MSLQGYVHQLRPRRESYINHVNKIQSLVETSTTEATYAEMAICYHYNLLRANGDMDRALSQAGMTLDDFKKLTPELLETGKNVANDMGDRGPWLLHSGSGSVETNYEQGRDKTPKADFTGNNKNYISLKKSGDSGAGAQLMSAKSGEASGVVKSAIGHYEKNTSDKISQDADFLEAVDILENKMKETARNDLNVEVLKGKQDFESWYTTKSSQAIKLKLNRKLKPKDIEKHLKAELSLLGATRMSASARKNLIKGVTPITKSEIDNEFKIYQSDGDVKVGDVKVSARNLVNVSPDKLTNPKLKKQIVDVIQTSINATEWQIKLQKWFDNNNELKKWLVYEAASGLFKFTGQYSDGKNYFGSQSAVANKILVFSDRGIKNEYDILKYSMDNPQLANKLSVSYKGSGRSKYIKLGIAASYESELPFLQEELHQLQRQYVLTEGIFRTLKNKFLGFVNKLRDIIKIFYERVIKKFIDGIKNIANRGITVFLDALGLEVDGTVSFQTPSW
tara:strand:- start:55 stop:1575 length:1521 start_codon:yes stop_codon:yes gene_type:complete